ncbi:MAG: LapA family protein [Cyanothece sp. SIO1E1]|nr:LapA family protein [Cyanothece sp. SIO1E1]
MRQINFVVIFIICLALLLFGIENTEPTVIHIAKDIDLAAPLSVVLVIVLGLGAVLAWIFSVWIQVQTRLSSGRVIKQRDVEIEQLQADIQRYRVELEQQQPLLPPSEAGANQAMRVEDRETTEVA